MYAVYGSVSAVMYLRIDGSVNGEYLLPVKERCVPGQGHLIGENGAFSFPLKEGGEEVRTAPHVYVSSLWDKIQALLDQHERYLEYSPPLAFV